MNRRDFLNISLATATTAALAGCGLPAEPAFVSQAQMPEFYLPGIAQWFATTCSECSAGCGLGVRVIGGRAKKVEGIESHPLSRGGHCLRAETSLQALYNPDRLQQPWKRSGNDLTPVGNWDDAVKALAASFDQMDGLWITGPLTGTVGSLIVTAARWCGARIWVLDFPGTGAERAAMSAIGGDGSPPWYSFADADYVVNFGGDFLSSWHPNNVEYGWQYGEFRNGKGRTRRGILVSFCSRMNLTVSCSDRWVPVRPGTEGLIASAIAGRLGKGGGKTTSVEEAARAAGIDPHLIERLAERLKSAKKAVAIGGFENTAYSNGVSAMTAIAALNKALPGHEAQSIDSDLLVAPRGMSVSVPPDLLISARQALDGLKKGSFGTVWVNDVNPAYLLPQKSLGVVDALRKAHTYAFTPFVTETSLAAEWVMATTSMLEQWGDVRVEGPVPVYGIQQPVVLPVPGSKPLGDLLLASFTYNPKLAALLPKDKNKREVATMRELLKLGFSEPDWVRALERGGVYKDAPLDWSPYAAPMHPPPPNPPTAAAIPAAIKVWQRAKAQGSGEAVAPKFTGKGAYVLVPYPSPTLGDGSIANRPWVPELPDPMMQSVWTTWVEINIDVCKNLEIARMDLVEIQSDNGQAFTLPAMPTPAVHPEVVAIPMGLGHTSFGRYAAGVGYNPMNLVEPTFQEGTDGLVWASTNVNIRKTGKRGWVTTYDWRAGDMPRALEEK